MKKLTLFLTTLSVVSLITANSAPKKDAMAITQAITRGGTLTSNNVGQFDSYIKNSEKPVIVKFWAPGCPSCKSIHKHFVALSQQHADKAIFVTVNTKPSAHKALLKRYNIKRIPTFMFFKDGNVHHKVLSPSASKLKNLVSNFVK